MEQDFTTDLLHGIVVTSMVATLRDFLTRPGTRHSFLVGPAASGKTSALHYLASSLRSENHLVVMVTLRLIDTSDQLGVTIARAVLNQSVSQNTQTNDSLNQLLAQFKKEFTVSQKLSRSFIDWLIQSVIKHSKFQPHAYIFLDGLDEMRQEGEMFFAIEDLAKQLESASLVVTSRESPLMDRLKRRTAFDTFTLAPFTNAEVMEFLRLRFPDVRFQQADLEALIEMSTGNPLLLGLLADAFLDDDVKASINSSNPLQTLLGKFFAGLLENDQAGMDINRLLTLLVFFQPVSITWLTQMAGLSAERSHSAFQKLLEWPLVRSSDVQVAFAHFSFAEYYLENNIITYNIDTSAFQFGEESAERDILLKQSFMEPRALQFIRSGAKTIILGDRGAGKSAIFRALKEWNNDQPDPENAGRTHILISVSKNPTSFVQQMIADNSAPLSADRFKAVWLLYCAALAARDVDVTELSDTQNTKTFVKDSRAILRRIGWPNSIKGEGRISRWWTVVRSVVPEKVTFTLGPITIEPNLKPRERGWFGNDIKIDEFIDRADLLLQSNKRQLLIILDQIDDTFKYERDKQEVLVQGLFLAESFLSLKQAIRLVVLLRTDLFELYNIQETNKFVSRTVRLRWNRDELRQQLLQRLFSNSDLRAVMESLQGMVLPPDVLTQMQFRIVFPLEIEGKPFEEWLFENLKNGKDQIAPRQIILFLIFTKENAQNDASRRRIPLFREKEVADAMTRLSESSYQEAIKDIQAATTFILNCRAGKITEFELEKVQPLFNTDQGSVALQVEQLERLGFLTRVVVQEGNSFLQHFRIPRLFTRCWETSD